LLRNIQTNLLQTGREIEQSTLAYLKSFGKLIARVHYCNFPNLIKEDFIMKKDTLRQILVVIGVVLTIAVNIMANALPINGQNTGEISDSFKVFFVPAGYVFSIWGLIYIGLIAFAVFQALPSQKENPSMRSIGYIFVLSCLANCAWIFSWHYNYFVLSLGLMLVLLACLIVIYLRLDIGRTQVSRGQKWCVNIPISVYLGWITVATVANVTDVLYYLGWTGGPISPDVWAVIMLVVATVIGLLVAFTRADIAYLLVLIWAFIGIAIKHAEVQIVSTTAWVMSGVLAVLILYLLYRKFTKANQPLPA
jgi:hypothetical protein